ncbi:MAG: GHKL domain-containing protein [Anaerolineae bacterium]|nr:GHKL domain-containing protein [Anaerolineae bacterium]
MLLIDSETITPEGTSPAVALNLISLLSSPPSPNRPSKASSEILKEQVDYFASHDALRFLWDTVPDVFLILNEQKHIVFANRHAIKLFELAEDELKNGLRPGDVLECVNSVEAGGCTNTIFCRTCNARKAILSSLNGEDEIEECRINTIQGKALDFRVWTQSFIINGWKFSLVTLKDITHEKRRQALEHIFFHDLLNIAGTMVSLTSLIQEMPPEDLDQELKTVMHELSKRMVEEIHAQRDLVSAENDELQVNAAPTYTQDILEEIKAYYSSHALAKNRLIAIDPASAQALFVTDPVLLRRILGNMVKNALEACLVGQTVTLSSKLNANSIEFTVHNPAVIPDDVQLQIFQRSFSTKGPGRGLGTYSMKLLTEHYLHGQISFTSAPENGTRFTVRYPLELPITQAS